MRLPSRFGGKKILRAALTASAIVATLGFETTPGQAQGFFRWFDSLFPIGPNRVWRGSPRSHPRAARNAFRRGLNTSGAPSEPETKPIESANPERPLLVIASIADQRVSLYNHQGLVARSAISTGIAGHPTPKGIFTIIGRERFHRSNIYSAALMPFMQRITWSGIAMHLGVVPRHPASHGCIRLPAEFAAKLWGWTKIGERVVISPQDVTPAEFAHPLLPAPKMRILTEADKAPSLEAPGTSVVVAPPQRVNPLQYAELLKVKVAAAVKSVKEISAAISLKRQEVARAATELKSVARAHASASWKAVGAARAKEIAAADASAKQQKSALAAAQFSASEGDASSRAKVDRLAKAYEDATAAKDAAALAKLNADATLAESAAKLAIAKATSAAKVAEAADAIRRLGEARVVLNAVTNAEKEARRRAMPVSVLVSKKDQRIYVRQGLAPVFDAPASVRDPERLLGSHLYIATAAKDDGTSLKWSVVSMPIQNAEELNDRRMKTGLVDELVDATADPRGPPSGPAEALERIEIAQEVRDRIAERLWIGGSLIISDLPLSSETGNIGTDLTVKIHEKD